MVHIKKWTTEADCNHIKPWEKFTSITYDWNGGLKKFAGQLRADIDESTDPLKKHCLEFVLGKLNEAVANGVGDWSEAKFKAFRWKCERDIVESREEICEKLSIDEDAVYEQIKQLDLYIDDSVV